MTSPEDAAVAFVARKRRHSQTTFGDQSPTGVCRHAEKEVEEVACAPSDDGEWADICLLAIDGAWRAGASDETIGATLTAALESAGIETLFDVAGVDLVRTAVAAVAANPQNTDAWITLLGTTVSAWKSYTAHGRMEVLEARQTRNEARAWQTPASRDVPVEHVEPPI